MSFEYVVTIDTQKNCPVVQVSSQELWDLVEFLSIQRLAVSFTYGTNHFAVTFLRLDLAGAQMLINEWMQGRKHAQRALPQGQPR